MCCNDFHGEIYIQLFGIFVRGKLIIPLPQGLLLIAVALMFVTGVYKGRNSKTNRN